MFDGLIEGSVATAISGAVKESDVIELRMRVAKPLVVQTLSNRFALKQNGLPLVVGRSDIDRVIAKASKYSVYAVDDEMKKGYIPYGKYRIGVAGEGVLDDGKLLSVKNVSSIVIRVPHQVKTAADEIASETVDNHLSTLVISPPAAGKTTMLRELARLASKRFNTVIIDERYELASCVDGKPQLDIGDADVVSGVPKIVAYENCVRALNPEIIVTDEVFRDGEIDAVCDTIRSGVKVFASVHGDSIESLANNKRFAPLFDAFDFAVVLSKRRRVGEIVEKRRL